MPCEGGDSKTEKTCRITGYSLRWDRRSRPPPHSLQHADLSVQDRVLSDRLRMRKLFFLSPVTAREGWVEQAERRAAKQTRRWAAGRRLGRYRAVSALGPSAACHGPPLPTFGFDPTAAPHSIAIQLRRRCHEDSAEASHRLQPRGACGARLRPHAAVVRTAAASAALTLGRASGGGGGDSGGGGSGGGEGGVGGSGGGVGVGGWRGGAATCVQWRRTVRVGAAVGRMAAPAVQYRSWSPPHAATRAVDVRRVQRARLAT
eukprot:3663041-Prymnesium_polylepis.2